jgi:hypothetical protein
MLVHKTKSRQTTKGVALPGFSLFAIIAIILMLIALALPRFYTSEPQTGKNPSEAPFAVFRDEENRFSIGYPLNWHVTPNQQGTGVLTIISKPGDKIDVGGGNFSVGQVNSAPTPLTDFSKIDILTYEIVDGITPYQLMRGKSVFAPSVNYQAVKIGGYDAVRVDVDSLDTVTGQYYVKSYTSVFLIAGERGYMIGGFADEVTFNRILQSFRAW